MHPDLRRPARVNPDARHRTGRFFGEAIFTRCVDRKGVRSFAARPKQGAASVESTPTCLRQQKPCVREPGQVGGFETMAPVLGSRPVAAVLRRMDRWQRKQMSAASTAFLSIYGITCNVFRDRDLLPEKTFLGILSRKQNSVVY